MLLCSTLNQIQISELVLGVAVLRLPGGPGQGGEPGGDHRPRAGQHPPRAVDRLRPPGRRLARQQGWEFMSCSHCQELGQLASWLLISYTRVNNQLGLKSAS